LGMLSGALVAWGARPRFAHFGPSNASWIVDLVVGSAAAALLNGASNVLNQVYDVEIDRINKPGRVLPSGRLSPRAALAIAAALYAVSLSAACTINFQCFVLFVAGAVSTVLYSAPPFRLKRFVWVSNLTIAIPRGVLLKVAGWSVAKSVWSPEAWFIGLVFGLFLFGATSSKDFADMEGDRAGGIDTVPLRYGQHTAVKLMYPFFTLPFLLLAAGTIGGVFSGNRVLLVILGLACAAWGHWVTRLLLRDPSERLTENHPSWRQMYYLMFALQVGLMIAYIV
ncbi:MAG: UbiA family prenyltransferase, partial [Deltaproteobacteria bacterium]|nr:UbiA family prenyltransferase [Deltaproteobacteria bacterium]